jgi:hypothetical protein
MSQHKIVKIPKLLTPDTENYINEVGKDGWELVHIINQHAYMKSSAGGTITSGSLNAMVDAFGRTRTSEAFTLGDYKHTYGGIENGFINKLTGDGDIVNNISRASVTLSATTNGSSAVHQTKMYHHYMPGKSQVILSSFIFGLPVSGSTKRTGYFDDYNGIFLEQDATGSLQFVIRTATDGLASVTEHRVKQVDWNINTLLDGEFILDMTTTQLLYIDFQWLAVGRVRMGFVYKGITVICHVFDHTNILDVAYMQTPDLPIRCEIANSVTTITPSSMEQICSTVISEGGYAEAGKAFSVSNETFRSLTSGSTLPIIAIRLKNNINGLPNRGFVRIQDASVFTDQKTVRYALSKVPSGSALTTASAWISADPFSIVEYNVSATAVNNRQIMLSGFIGANALNPRQASPASHHQSGVANKQNFIAQNYDSTDSEIYVLSAKNMTGDTTSVGGTILWSEIY